MPRTGRMPRTSESSPASEAPLASVGARAYSEGRWAKSPRQEERVMDWKIELIFVPVSDVDRSKEFYEKIGFHADHDQVPYDGLRFVQMLSLIHI